MREKTETSLLVVKRLSICSGRSAGVSCRRLGSTRSSCSGGRRSRRPRSRRLRSRRRRNIGEEAINSQNFLKIGISLISRGIWGLRRSRVGHPKRSAVIMKYLLHPFLMLPLLIKLVVNSTEAVPQTPQSPILQCLSLSIRSIVTSILFNCFSKAVGFLSSSSAEVKGKLVKSRGGDGALDEGPVTGEG